MKKSYIKSLKRQAGATLLEQMLWLLGTLAIIAFVIFMKNTVIPMVNGWRGGSMAGKAMTQANSTFNGANSFAGATTAMFAVRSFYDDKYLNAGTITNVFGGQVTYAVSTIRTANDTLQQTETGVPRRSCETYVNNIASDVDRVSVGGVLVKDVGAAINVPTLVTQCNSADVLTMLNEKIKS